MKIITFLGGSLLLLLATTAVQAAAELFRCEANGRTILTDKPALGAECRPLDAPRVNIFESAPVRASAASTSRSKAPARQESDSIANEQIKAKQRCQRLQQRLDAIVDKMRRGYTLKQEERFRDQQRDLEGQQQIEKCR